MVGIQFHLNVVRFGREGAHNYRDCLIRLSAGAREECRLTRSSLLMRSTQSSTLVGTLKIIGYMEANRVQQRRYRPTTLWTGLKSIQSNMAVPNASRDLTDGRRSILAKRGRCQRSLNLTLLIALPIRLRCTESRGLGALSRTRCQQLLRSESKGLFGNSRRIEKQCDAQETSPIILYRAGRRTNQVQFEPSI